MLNKRSRQATSDDGEYVQVLKKIKQPLDYITELLEVQRQTNTNTSKDKDLVELPYSYLWLLNSHKEIEYRIGRLPISSNQNSDSPNLYLEDASHFLNEDEEEEQHNPISEELHQQQEGLAEVLLLLDNDELCSSLSATQEEDPIFDEEEDQAKEYRREKYIREYFEHGLTINGVRAVWRRTQNKFFFH